MKILVSGGTGYIGSHTCVELLNKGYEVVAFDNLYNSKIDVVDRVEKITGRKLVFLHPPPSCSQMQEVTSKSVSCLFRRKNVSSFISIVCLLCEQNTPYFRHPFRFLPIHANGEE